MLKLISIIYALVLFFNISSDVRCMKISRKKGKGTCYRHMVKYNSNRVLAYIHCKGHALIATSTCGTHLKTHGKIQLKLEFKHICTARGTCWLMETISNSYSIYTACGTRLQVNCSLIIFSRGLLCISMRWYSLVAFVAIHEAARMLRSLHINEAVSIFISFFLCISTRQ